MVNERTMRLDHDEVTDLTSNLPVELMERIFQLLSPRDLLVAVLVCRRWRVLGETPELWSSLPITVTARNLSMMPEILASRRLSAVSKFIIKPRVSQQFLLSLLDRQGVRELVIYSSLWSPPPAPPVSTNHQFYRTPVDKALLAKPVTRLEASDVRYTPLTPKQTKTAQEIIEVIKAAAVMGCTITLI